MFKFDSLLTLDILIFSILIILINFLIISKRKVIAFNLRLNDYPSERKIHNTPTPLIGGICIFITLLPLNYIFYLYGEITLINFLTTVLAYTIFFLVGLRDDIQALSPKVKTLIIIFTLITLLLINDNYLIYDLQFKFTNRQINLDIFSFVFSLFCFFALYNALNFIDGYNGLSISISIYWLLFLLIKNPNFVYLITIIILTIIYLYNVQGKFFLGNSGTSLLSIFFSISIINDYNTLKTVYADEILFLLFIPGIDMIRVTIERVIKKKHIYSPDKLHLHHYLIKNNFDYIWEIILILTLLPYIFLNLIKNTEATLMISIILYFAIYIFLRKND